MRETPVGMKCRACARMPARARGVGKPRHWVMAGGAGLATAIVLGALVTLAHIGLYGIIFPIIAGLIVGRAVAWGAHGNRHGGFMALAAATSVVGLVAGGALAGHPAEIVGPASLLGLVLSAIAAAFVVNR